MLLFLVLGNDVDTIGRSRLDLESVCPLLILFKQSVLWKPKNERSHDFACFLAFLRVDLGW